MLKLSTLCVMHMSIDCGQSRVRCGGDDKGRIGLYPKLCDFTLLFMILQVELRLNKDH